MSELTLTLLRLGLLALLWIFIFSVVGVLRTDIYGTAVSRRSQRKALKKAQATEAKRPARGAPTHERTRALRTDGSGPDTVMTPSTPNSANSANRTGSSTVQT